MLGNKLEDKIKVWKDLRNKLEDHPRPFDMLVQFTNKLHVSSKKVNAFDPDSKIEPWHLIEKNEFTEYEIAQLIAYTLQLTDRFCTPHPDTYRKDTKKDNLVYLVYLDKGIILGYYNEAITIDELPKHIVSQKIYRLPPIH